MQYGNTLAGSPAPYRHDSRSDYVTPPSQGERRHLNDGEAGERRAAGVQYQSTSYSSQPTSYPSSDSSYSYNSDSYGYSSSSSQGKYRPPLDEGTARRRKNDGVGSTFGHYENNNPPPVIHTHVHAGHGWTPFYGHVPYRYRPAHGIGLAILFPIVLMACVPELLPFAVLLLGAGAFAAITCCACKALGRQRSEERYADF